jgi:hypothetical protein
MVAATERTGSMEGKMMKRFHRKRLGIAALALLTGGAAMAAPEAAPAEADRQSSPERVYCVLFKSVGSRIPKKLCLTKKEWLREGIDIEAAAAGK